MSPQGRPKGEYRNAQHGGCLMTAAGPSQGGSAPSGGSAVHVVTSVGAT